jgi:ABC-type transporter Mla subunit MlaD
MRRLLAILALGLALPALVVLGVAADGEGPGAGYEVRAVFDNVASAVPGEDVKVAGAKVGVIKSMDVTPSKKAAVVLRINDARFTPFRADAHCSVRPQSLIGEKFVECQPGTSSQPALARIDRGDGEGQHLLPLARTSSPVDLDLINNIMRRPYRERLAILLGELGTGVAGRGQDLNEVIHRANPALRETDRVLSTLARQNRTLARLATESDQSLAPLARERRRVTGFIEQAGVTGAATAERREDIRRSLRLLPAFLRELRPTMAELGDFAGQATPVARDLNRSGTQVSRMIRQLGPFSKAARSSLVTLGDAARTGRPAVIRTRPLIRDLGSLGKSARPLSADLDALTASIDKTGGIERLMDLIYFGALSTNGFDDISHYLRTSLLINLCTSYQVVPDAGCTANFKEPTTGSSAARTDQRAKVSSSTKGGSGDSGAAAGPGMVGGILRDGALAPEGKKAIERMRKQAEDGSPAFKDQKEPALDYLLGNGN